MDVVPIRSFRKSYFHVSYTSGTLTRQRPRLDGACQRCKMTTVLNSLYFLWNISFNLLSLYFLFNISFLPSYCVKCYDCIVKWGHVAVAPLYGCVGAKSCLNTFCLQRRVCELGRKIQTYTSQFHHLPHLCHHADHNIRHQLQG